MFGIETLKAQGAHGWHEAAERIAHVRAELVRRNALAFQPQPRNVGRPSLRRMLSEFGSPAEVWHAAMRDGRAPTALRPQPVMLLPGFGTHPVRMKRMRVTLERAGHRVSDWGLGFNFGPSEERFERLLSRIEAMANKECEPLALVGWSLGGIFAREAARHAPRAVAKVITMGTPFSGDRRANNAWRAYQWITGHEVDAPPVGENLSAKPPVPTIALWSPRDGIVAPRAACGRPGERDRAVALRCTHLGFANHPAVIAEVLRQLDLAD